MKKLLVTGFMAILMPTLCVDYIGSGICLAEESSKQKPPDFPDVAPVYNSYYDDSDGFLYIYGGIQNTVITVEVTYHGQTIVMDMLSPNDLPTQYDFNGCASGTYYVTISAGTTVLKTFSFNIF